MIQKKHILSITLLSTSLFGCTTRTMDGSPKDDTKRILKTLLKRQEDLALTLANELCFLERWIASLLVQLEASKHDPFSHDPFSSEMRITSLKEKRIASLISKRRTKLFDRIHQICDDSDESDTE